MRNSKRGFTLVEVLLSVVIFGIVAVTVYRVFAVALKVNQRVDQNLQMNLAVLSVIHSLEKDLNNTVRYRFASGSHSIEGSSRSLAMVVGQEGGLKVVRYSIDEGGNLFRAEISPQESLSAVDEVEGQRIAAGLKDAFFSFGYLKSDDNAMIIWQDLWETDVLPFAVRWKAQISTGAGHAYWIPFERTIVIPHGEWGSLT